jgi:putative ABC transport system ATP-binding protein
MLYVNDVSVTFNRGTPDCALALDRVTLHLPAGDFVTVIGSNGAGKSTLLNVICGTAEPDSGTIVLAGSDITAVPPHVRARQIGRLFQDPMKGTAPGMTIEENMALAAGLGGWFSAIRRQDRELFRERLSRLGMGLEDRLRSPVGSLSGGQRQALTLMMATFNPPKLLLLDEHTAALDPATAEKVLDITRRMISENSLTCLMITHNMRDALDLGNRTIMMDRGRVIYDAAGDERASLTVADLTERFREAAGREMAVDRIMLER